MDALHIQDIHKQYTHHVALNQVSLTIPEKSIYGLLGPNGAGKTTLIRIINQIINADKGEIYLFGEKLQPKHIGVIGYLPEERGLYKKLKVGEQLVYFARLKGLGRKEAIAKSKYWLSKFEIADWWDKKVEDLSKGMAQKVQFISTVMHEPRLIILDEPFSGFDPINAQLITQEIMALRANGSTIIFSTHRMETVEELCDHVALIDRARKILEGRKKDIRNQYKSNSFIIEHRTSFSLSSPEYQVSEQKKIEDDYYKSVIKITGNASSNQLIRDLTDITSVISFSEKIPSMGEIFISLVKQQTNPL